MRKCVKMHRCENWRVFSQTLQCIEDVGCIPIVFFVGNCHSGSSCSIDAPSSNLVWPHSFSGLSCKYGKYGKKAAISGNMQISWICTAYYVCYAATFFEQLFPKSELGELKRNNWNPRLCIGIIAKNQSQIWQNNHFLFLATLVALHFTPVSKSLSQWVSRSFGLA